MGQTLCNTKKKHLSKKQSQKTFTWAFATWGFLEMLFPELCDNSCLRWSPPYNSFILGSSLHMCKILIRSSLCVVFSLARTFLALLGRTVLPCTAAAIRSTANHPLLFCTPSLLYELPACLPTCKFVIFLSCGTHSFLTFHSSVDQVAWWNHGLFRRFVLAHCLRGASAELVRENAPGADKVMSYAQVVCKLCC